MIKRQLERRGKYLIIFIILMSFDSFSLSIRFDNLIIPPDSIGLDYVNSRPCITFNKHDTIKEFKTFGNKFVSIKKCIECVCDSMEVESSIIQNITVQEIKERSIIFYINDIADKLEIQKADIAYIYVEPSTDYKEKIYRQIRREMKWMGIMYWSSLAIISIITGLVLNATGALK